MVVPIMRVSGDKEIDVLDTTGLKSIQSALRQADLAKAKGDTKAEQEALEKYFQLSKQYGYSA